MERITWKTDEHGTEHGYVGKFRLFSISYSVYKGVGYVLHTTLPAKPKKGQETDQDPMVLKERAENFLERFVEAIGGCFDD